MLRPRLTITMAPLVLIRCLSMLRSPPTLLKRRLAAGLLSMHMACLAECCRSLAVSPMCRVLFLDNAAVGRLSCMQFSFILRRAMRQCVTFETGVKNLVVLLTGTLRILVTAWFPQRILRALWPQCVLRYILYGMQMLGRKPTLTPTALLFT